MSYDDIPPLLPPGDMPAVHNPADLQQTWRALMGTLGFPDRRLWLLFLDAEGQLLGPLLSMDNLPDGPYDLPVEDLVIICREILGGPGGAGGSVAFLVTRPGRDAWHVGDRAWGRYLTAAAYRIGGKVWPVHRANDEELAVVPAAETDGLASA